MTAAALPSDALAPLTREALAARIDALPALPTVASGLLRGFDDPDVDTAQLARQLAADQSLAARALRVANSPFYGLPGRVESIREAIMVLGLRAVRSLVFSAAVVRTLSATQTAAPFDARSFWRHGVAAAVAARHLAQHAGCSVDTAFTAGLLHDVGKLVLAVTCPQHYGAALAWQQQANCLANAAEQQVVGLTHADAGALLAERWGLPAAIGAAVAHHHHPGEAARQPLAAVVCAANVLAHGLGLADGGDEAVPPLDDAVCAALKLDWARLGGALSRIETEFEDTLNALID